MKKLVLSLHLLATLLTSSHIAADTAQSIQKKVVKTYNTIKKSSFFNPSTIAGIGLIATSIGAIATPSNPDQSPSSTYNPYLAGSALVLGYHLTKHGVAKSLGVSGVRKPLTVQERYLLKNRATRKIKKALAYIAGGIVLAIPHSFTGSHFYKTSHEGHAVDGTAYRNVVSGAANIDLNIKINPLYSTILLTQGFYELARSAYVYYVLTTEHSNPIVVQH